MTLFLQCCKASEHTYFFVDARKSRGGGVGDFRKFGKDRKYLFLAELVAKIRGYFYTFPTFTAVFSADLISLSEPGKDCCTCAGVLLCSLAMASSSGSPSSSLPFPSGANACSTGTVHFIELACTRKSLIKLLFIAILSISYHWRLFNLLIYSVYVVSYDVQFIHQWGPYYNLFIKKIMQLSITAAVQLIHQ